MKKIYLACPYSHPDSEIREKRYREVTRVAAELIKKGYIVFSPITHSHPLALLGLESGWEYWKTFDESIIQWCDELWILTLDEWEESKGIACEEVIANTLSKPICYVNPVTLEVV